MTTNNAKYFCILLIITQIARQLNAIDVQQENTINDEKRPTNQLTMQKQQLQHEYQEERPLQHKSVDETLPSYVSVSGAAHQQQQQNYKSSKIHESYDKIDDVVNDDDGVYTGNNHHNDNDDEDDVGVDYESAFDEENDNDFTDDNINALSRRKRDLSDWLIAPNTRWCGRGNSADGRYNHLGGASLADKCCRRHDHCKHYIPGMSERYEMFNYRPYTLSHCMCDRRFRTCLKMANDEDANTIGKLFFNMVQTQCFILKTEQICQKRAEDGTCEQHLSKKKAYIRTNKKF